jgi:hypothetical protein
MGQMTLVSTRSHSTDPAMQVEDGAPRDARVIVESEEEPDKLLLETKICKEDGFQKQQGMADDSPLAAHVWVWY